MADIPNTPKFVLSVEIYVYILLTTWIIMDYHTLQNATMSSIESDGTSSCSDCSLDEKPPINDQQDVVSVNEFSEGLNCSFRNQIAPGNPCQVPKPYSDDYEGVYDFVNEPPVPNNNSVLNGIYHKNLFLFFKLSKSNFFY